MGQRSVWITNRKKVIGRGIALPPVAPGLECMLFVDDVYAATFRFHDRPRHESRTFIKHLRPRHAVNRVLIVSGDRDQEVRRLAEQVGIAELLGQKPGRQGRYRPQGGDSGPYVVSRGWHQRRPGDASGSGRRCLWNAQPILRPRQPTQLSWKLPSDEWMS